MCVHAQVRSSCCEPLISRAQYGQDTGNPAATFHEVRVWRKEREPEGKPLIPLRMVRECVVVNRAHGNV